MKIVFSKDTDDRDMELIRAMLLGISEGTTERLNIEAVVNTFKNGETIEIRAIGALVSSGIDGIGVNVYRKKQLVKDTIVWTLET